jgi:hypothetical protein
MHTHTRRRMRTGEEPEDAAGDAGKLVRLGNYYLHRKLLLTGEEPENAPGDQEKSVRQQSLAEDDEDEAAARERVEREAAMVAAQKAEGTVHLDDQYAQVFVY